MSRPVPIIAGIILALGAVEAIAYWWMHPAPAGLGQPVLTYQPGFRGQGLEARDQNAEKSLASLEKSGGAPAGTGEGKTGDNGQGAGSGVVPPTNPQPSTSSTITPLPAVVEKALPTLRCSTGTAARIDRDDGTTIHLAFFEWNLADSTNVLEAFKHLPDECMGSIGMTITSHQPPRSYQVDGETLWFDHTVFRDQGGITVHAFKGTWVSGASSLIGNGFRGGADQWTQLRWKSALKRFHPAHARVAQGAVRGIPNSDLAWEAFEDAMLKDLTFAKR